ncbi:ankyrin repeat-containing domain protein [Xylariaceae sp. FL0255]|nr:ankyrin repeat-containing domain protein [Xylariaceae sp. FL0255]
MPPLDPGFEGDQGHTVSQQLDDMHLESDSANLSTLAPELLLCIAKHLPTLSDKLHLAQTSRTLSLILIQTLYEEDAESGDNHALWWACRYGNVGMLRNLIQRDPTIVHYMFKVNHEKHKSLDKNTAQLSSLSVATRAYSFECVEVLLAGGANPNKGDEGSRFWLPIHWALRRASSDSVRFIELLRERGADLDKTPDPAKVLALRKPRFYMHRTLDHVQGYTHAPIFLTLKLDKPVLKSHNNIDAKRFEFNNLFAQYCQKRHEQLITLLENGADANLKHADFQVTPIFYLLSSVDRFGVSFYDDVLMGHPSQVMEQSSIMHNAVGLMLQTLKRYGASFEEPCGQCCPNDFQWSADDTPIHMACRFDNCDKPIVFWFLDHGVPVDLATPSGRTPLMEFCNGTSFKMDMLKTLMQYRPNVNLQDKDGNTALHVACANPSIYAIREDTVKLLLKHGADPSILDNCGRMAADVISSFSLEGGQDPSREELREFLLSKVEEKKQAEEKRKQAEERKNKEKKKKSSRYKRQQERKRQQKQCKGTSGNSVNDRQT